MRTTVSGTHLHVGVCVGFPHPHPLPWCCAAAVGQHSNGSVTKKQNLTKKNKKNLYQSLVVLGAE
jgi:hypothetical protein